MNRPWSFPRLAAGSLPLGPVVRLTVALLAVGCVVLALLLLRTSVTVGDSGAKVGQHTVPMLAQRERALAGLEQLARHGSLAVHAGDAAIRSAQVVQAERIAAAPDFAFDDALRLRALNTASTIREVAERIDFAATLKAAQLEPQRAHRLRDAARASWRDAAQALEDDTRALATATRETVTTHLHEFEAAAAQLQTAVMRVIGVMLATLLIAGFLVLHLLLAPILRTVRSLETLAARQPAAALPSSVLAEIEAIYRSVERHAESLLQADALNWRSVAVDASANAIIITNAQGAIEYVNPAFTAVTGYTREEAIGQTPRLLKSGAHDADFYRQFWQTILSGREWRGELVNRRRDGTLFNDLTTVSPVLDERGRVVRFIAIHYDITRRKEVEGQLRARTEDLQRYRNQREGDDALARAIIDRQLRAADLCALGVHAWQLPATQFSGDIVAARRSPDGRLFVLLGDATGHGLAAAISVLPLLVRFDDCVARGCDLRQLVTELDRSMRATMPVDRFVAAIALCVDHTNRQTEAWLGGMPGLLLLDAEAGHSVHRFNSGDLPLGIAERTADEFQIERIVCPPGCQFALYSDGLVEAQAVGGHRFSDIALESVLRKLTAEHRLAAMRSNFLLHMDGNPAHDDVSFVLVDVDLRTAEAAP